MDERKDKENKRISSVKDLEVYRVGFEAAMEIFNLSRKFPLEERYSLTDQVRRSSRSVCTNLAEGWRKRKYKAVFVNKLLDAAQEAAETQTWLEFALRCNYIGTEEYQKLNEKYEYIFAMLTNMERKADSFCK
jgi:four helix bundle protein